MITIQVNKTEISIAKNTNILQLLQHINSPIKGVAVAIHQNIIYQTNWQTHILQDKDHVLIIQATQGG